MIFQSSDNFSVSLNSYIALHMQLSYRGLQSIGIHRMLILDQLFWRCVKEAGWSTLAIRAALKLLNMNFFLSLLGKVA